jgi:hypothetical protein
MSSAATTFTDNPRIKLISSAINPDFDIPNFTQSANEVSGVNTTQSSGFLRLTAQTPANSCIDLIGTNEHSTGRKYNNSVRIATGGVERMIIDGSGNIGVGTKPVVRLDVVGAVKITGELNMNSYGKIVNLVNPTNNQDAATKNYVDTSIPVGGIIMWSGTIASIPSNWKLCNGTNGTPDLRNRFIIGASIDATTTGTGGSDGVTKAHTEIEGNTLVTGGAKDAAVVSHNHSGFTNSGNNDGNHSHAIAPVSGTSFTINTMSSGTSLSGAVYANGGTDLNTGTELQATDGVLSAHKHTISTDGVSGTNKNLPPYYAIAFIMRGS